MNSMIFPPTDACITYAGKFKAKPLIDFLGEHAIDAPAKDDTKATSSDKRKPNSDAGAYPDDEEDDGQEKVVPQVQSLSAKMPCGVGFHPLAENVLSSVPMY
jgi:hypothetical protein